MYWTSPAPTKDSASLHLVYLCKAKDKHHQDQAGPFGLWRTRNPSSSYWQKSFTNVSGSYKKNKVCRHLYQTFVSFWPGVFLGGRGRVSFFAPQKGKLNFTACSGAFASTLLATINIRNAPSTNPSLY